MKQLTFCLGIHNHQPVGNFDHVFEAAYQDAYQPFLEVLERHASVRLAMHFSGALLSWLVERKPDFIARLRRLVAAGQVEIMTGGFYEPLLPIIPDADKVNQIRTLTEYVREVFGYEPQGMWLAERVWEPHLPRWIKAAGVRYIVVDDYHFKSTGLDESQTFGYYVTDELGEAICVFPISEKLRYTIPFQAPEATLEYFSEIATESGERIIVMADDGEKFGVWPHTHKHCYGDGWLESFFRALEENRDWVRLKTFSEVVSERKPFGRVFLPTASYIEMMEWALPAPAIPRYEDFVTWLKANEHYEPNKIFVRGGFWRSFLSKYPESNHMHKRMLRVSEKVNSLLRKFPDEPNVREAQDRLFRAQNNDAYWHGIFGGLYLPHLRNAVYRNLIEAESLIDPYLHKRKQWIESEVIDLDVDSDDELIVESGVQGLYFKPSYGGALVEHDFKARGVNLLDTLYRREEGYHSKIVAGQSSAAGAPTDGAISIHSLLGAKETGLERYLRYDWHRRYSLLLHFFPIGTTLEAFSSCRYDEMGDFVNQAFEFSVERKRGRLRIVLERTGHVRSQQGVVAVKVAKEIDIAPADGGFRISYRVTNLGNGALDAIFGIEFNVNLLAGNAPDRYYYIAGQSLEDRRLASAGENAGVRTFGLVDEYLKVKVTFQLDEDALLWRFPIETVSMSEAGFERIYQSSVVLPHWEIHLEPGATRQFGLVYSVEGI